jgi:hypothetical protein
MPCYPPLPSPPTAPSCEAIPFADCSALWQKNPSADSALKGILARDTHEARLVVRVGDWVFKYLRPADQYARATGVPPQARRRELRLRAMESHRHAELNPLWLDEERNVVVSRYVAGRMASPAEVAELLDGFARSTRGFITDLTPANVRMVSGRPFVIDFALAIGGRDWRLRAARLSAGAEGRFPTWPWSSDDSS